MAFSRRLRFKKVAIAVECGGMNGYRPDIRLVFDSVTNEWIITPCCPKNDSKY